MELSGKPPRTIAAFARRSGVKALRAGYKLSGPLGSETQGRLKDLGFQALAFVGARPLRPYTDFDTVFDADFYLTQVGENISPLTPKEHYCFIGWREFIDPSPLFDVAWYVDQYPDVVVGEFDPLSDYLLAGWKVGRDPAPWFSTSWYLEQLAIHQIGAVNPLVHYCEEGVRLGLTVSVQHFESLARRRRDPNDGLVDPTHAMIEIGGSTIPVTSLESFGSGLISVDVWDTLIERERPADAAKLSTTRRLAQYLGRPTEAWPLFKKRVEIEAQLAQADAAEEYHARDVIARLVEHTAQNSRIDVDTVTDSLYAAEVADECESTQRREPLASVISRRIQDGLPTAILSDFYMGANDLGLILKSSSIDVPTQDILSSVDIKASKRLGTAFAVLPGRYEAVKDDHLHIGDNPWSDGEQATRAGAQAGLISPPESSWPRPGELTRDWFDIVPSILVREADEMVRPMATAHRSSVRERRAISAAGTLSLMSLALVARAIDAAIERGLASVHYVSREGAFLAQIHRAVAATLVGENAPRAIHIATSRRASFGPSLGRIGPEEISLIARQYPTQSVKGLLRSLGLDTDAFAPEFAVLPYSPDEPVRIDEDLALLEFLERPAVRTRIEAMLGHQRDLLKQYLNGRELESGSVVVDVGWRGTIQDNLSRLTEQSLHGVYLGLFPYLNPQSSLVTKEAVAFDGNLGESFGWLDPPAIIESPMTPSIAACVAYQAVGDRVEPVFEAEPGRAEQQIDAMQEAALLVAPALARRWTLLGVEPSAVRVGLRQVLEDIYAAPPPGFADIWFDSGHDDTFGAGNVTPYAKPAPSVDLLYTSDDVRSSPAALSTRWPAGYETWLPIETIVSARQLRTASKDKERADAD